MQTKIKWCVNGASVLFLLAASVLPFRACRFGHHGLNDDAYITLCYAKNLVQGNGFVFNHPPPTLGTSTPLSAVAVAGVSRLLPSLEVARVATCLTALLWALFPWIVLGFRRILDLQVWEAAVVGLFVLAFREPSIGAEPIPFQVLLLCSVGLFAGGRYWSAGFTAGLLTLCRGEGVLLVPIFGVRLLFRDVRATGWRSTSFRHHIMASLRCPKSLLAKNKPLMRLSLGAAIPLLLWAVYAQSTFGYVIPQTLWVKIQQGRGLPIRSQFLGELLDNSKGWVVLGLPRLPGIMLLQWAMAGVGLWSALFRRRGWAPYVMWCIGYIGAYGAFGLPGWYWWYRIPVYWCWTVLCALGLCHSVRFMGQTLSRLIRGSDVVLAGAAMALAWAAVVRDAGTVRTPFLDGRTEVYLEICRWMNQNTDPNASLAAAEVGYFGYFTSNRIVDLSGLTMPRRSRAMDPGNREATLYHYKPDFYLQGFRPEMGSPGHFAIGDLKYRKVKLFKSARTHGYVLYTKTGKWRDPSIILPKG